MPSVVATSNNPSTPTVEFITNRLDEEIVLSSFSCRALLTIVLISPKLLKKLEILSSIGSGVMYL